MKDLLKFLQEVWNAAGFPGVAAIFGAVIAVLGSGLPFVWGLVVKLWQFRQQRKLQRDLFPFYSKQEIQRATQYYVETSCQNIAPSKEDEPRQTHAFATKQKILPFFLKQAFKSDKDDCQFYMVLADSGMGKTTFLINLYLRYTDQFVKPPYKIRLLPLAAPEVDKEIEAIKDDEKKQTILLLDAFDEDIKALQDHQARLNELVQKVWKFREVVITCRTQFFPTEEEEPKETGILQYGGEGGVREFRKVYLSPFDDDNITTYLNKRFAYWHWRKKRKARQIVEKCPNLMVRPMLLSHIDDLLGSDSPYTATYMVYAELIHKWVEREAKKVEPANPLPYQEKLFEFSRAIAVDMYRKRKERQGRLLIPAAEIQPFADEHGVRLSEMEMKSRSLLNRNAQGEYKFSHKSILEYFLAEEALFNAEFRKELSFDGMDQARTFFQEMVWEQYTLPMLTRGELRGEYAINNEKPKALANAPLKSLQSTTRLILTEWKTRDDGLLAIYGLKQGFQSLKQMELIGAEFTSEQIGRVQAALPGCQVRQRIVISLRSNPKIVTEEDFKQEFQLTENQRPLKYIKNDYADQGKVVLDRATGLMWQKAGSPKRLDYQDAQKYIENLNTTKFAGYDDWRMPTIPELMSLLEPEKQSNGLYLNPIFEKPKEYPWYWSADKRREKGEGSAESAWFVYFYGGVVYWGNLSNYSYVRGVRS